MAAYAGRYLARFLRRAADAVVARTPDATVSASYKGINFPLRLSDNLQRHLFFQGEYEGALLELLEAYVQDGDVVVDIGANIGVHALPLAAKLLPSAGRVYAFEAAPDTAAELQRTADSHCLTNVVVCNIALGAERRRAVLRSSAQYGPGDRGVRSLYGSGIAEIEVEVQPFDAWAGETGLDRLDVVKIDVEGAEYEVLVGMRGSIAALTPRFIVVEMLPSLLAAAGATTSDVRQLLVELGYALVGMTESDLHAGRYGRYGANGVFLRT
jgi:FkbM family methyltransferase